MNKELNNVTLNKEELDLVTGGKLNRAWSLFVSGFAGWFVVTPLVGWALWMASLGVAIYDTTYNPDR